MSTTTPIKYNLRGRPKKGETAEEARVRRIKEQKADARKAKRAA